jgi:hypothetical protein
MSRGFERRHSFVPGGESLEGRLALSAIGPPRAVPQTAHVEAIAGHPSNHTDLKPIAATPRRWSWLANTYWNVPTSNLTAIFVNSSTGSVTTVSDQTVFHITGYHDGYFWGESVTQFGSSPSTARTMAGSVTPQGRVVLDFTSTSSSGTSVTQGYGEMQKKFGHWTMENQMFSSGGTIQVGHWAYMVQTHPGLPSWHSLPGAGVSVPVFLSEAGGSGTQSIGS